MTTTRECPFCGSVSVCPMTEGAYQSRVFCQKCGAAGPVTCNGPQHAWEKWNQRRGCCSRRTESETPCPKLPEPPQPTHF